MKRTRHKLLIIRELRFIVGFSIFCTLATPAHTQIFNKNNEPVQNGPEIPTPAGGRVTALKGQVATFELSAATNSPASVVEFLIRDFPLAGTITSLRSKPTDQKKAIMKYTPNLNTAATTDSFTFSVRYQNGTWSAPATFKIDLLDALPKIKAANIFEFGRVMVGDESVKEIFIKNEGTAIYEKTLKLSSPWYLLSPEDGNVKLPIGGSTVLKVAYRPRLSEKQNYRLTLNRNAGGMPELRAEGYFPFSLDVQEIKLEPNEDRGIREGELKILSHAPKSLVLTLEKNDRLELGKQTNRIVVSAGEVLTVPVYLPASDVLSFESTVSLSTETGYVETATVSAATAPGRLNLEIPGADSTSLINLNEVLHGESAELTVLVKNDGGQQINVEVNLDPPFRIDGEPPGTLDPGESFPVKVKFEPGPADIGLFDQIVSFDSGKREKSIRVLAIGKRPPNSDEPPRIGAGFSNPPSGMPSSTGAPKSPSSPRVGNGAPPRATGSFSKSPSQAQMDKLIAELRTVQSASGFVTTAIKERTTANKLSPPTDFSVPSAKPTSLVLGWKAPPNSSTNAFELEIRGERINSRTGQLESVWIPYTAAEIKQEDDFVTATIENLFPASLYEFRAFTIDAGGNSSPPSRPFGVSTPLPMDWTYIYLFSALFLGGAIVIGGTRYLIKRRQAEGNGFVDPLDY